MKTKKQVALARQQYETLSDKEWRKDFFSKKNGGYLATSWKRIDEAIQKNEPEKFKMEHRMCLVFAKAGYRIKHFEDEKPEGSFDVTINEINGDLKKTRSTNNIIRYSKHALKVQKADVILIEFEKWGSAFREIISEMARKGIHGYYYVSGTDAIHSF